MAAIHKRFDEDSESDKDAKYSAAIAIEKTQENAFAKNDGPESESDDDGAPEAVSTSAAVSASKDAQRKIAQTVRQAGEQEKTRRKKLDASRVKQTRSRRKAQVEAATEQGKYVGEREGREEKDSGEAAFARPENPEEDDGGSDDEYDIPMLPPEVIAAAERADRMPKPLVPKHRQPAIKQRKRKFIDADPNPVKDIRVGSTTIHVLEKDSKTLPPKATPRGSNAREAWLTNSRGTAGQSGSKPWKSSFVKR